MLENIRDQFLSSPQGLTPFVAILFCLLKFSVEFEDFISLSREKLFGSSPVTFGALKNSQREQSGIGGVVDGHGGHGHSTRHLSDR